MKIAIVGSSGYIAGFLLKHFEKEKDIEAVLKIDRTQGAGGRLDLAEPEAFDYSLLDDVDSVVFTAAVSGPDRCAAEYDFCWGVNVEGTSYFIGRALEKNCRVLFFSSDAVFGDIPGKIYDEASETCAQTPYGKMKKAVEDRFKGNPNFKAIRLSYVVSARDKFVSYCLSCLEKGEAAEVFHPFYRNCICVTDVVAAVDWLLWHWEEYHPFALDAAGTELVSRVRIADEINRICGGRLRYVVTQPDGSFYQNRPQITQMKSMYLEPCQIIKQETFTEKIQKELAEIL